MGVLPSEKEREGHLERLELPAFSESRTATFCWCMFCVLSNPGLGGELSVFRLTSALVMSS